MSKILSWVTRIVNFTLAVILLLMLYNILYQIKYATEYIEHNKTAIEKHNETIKP